MRDINIFNTDMFPYLEGEEIKGETLTLTIKDIRPEEMQAHKGGKEVKEVLYFRETKKGFVLNKTNSKTIAQMYGRQTAQWEGKEITLTTEEVQAFGQLHNALRVVPGAISLFPDNNPGKGEFFKKAQDAGFEPSDAAEVLKAAGFNGYEPYKAPDMWKAIIAEYNARKTMQNTPSSEQPMPQAQAVQPVDDLPELFPEPDATQTAPVEDEPF